MRLFLIFQFFIIPFINGITQTTSSSNIFNVLSNDSRGGKIRIIQDPKLQNLLNKHQLINAKTGKIPGWRIRIYSDLGNYARDASLESKTKFMNAFPDIPVYRQYASPYFKVYVGDFRTRQDAIRALRRIKTEFPNAFPVSTQINYPEIK